MIDVRVRYTRAAQGDPSMLLRLKRPMVLGQALAAHVAERVARQGRTATPIDAYKGEVKGRAFVVSEAYAAQAGTAGPRWRSSMAFHAATGTRVGTARVTGGMWSGLQVRNSGADTAILDFGGSSLGAKRQATKTKSGRQRSRPVLIRNQIKAGAVFRHSRVNVLQPTDTENEALGAAVAYWAQTLVSRTLGGEVGRFSPAGDPALLARLTNKPI